MMKFLKKMITLFVVLTIVLQMIPPFYETISSANMVSIKLHNEAIEEISLPQNEKIRLQSNVKQLDVDEYQWQIAKSANDDWVNIYGQSSRDLMVSYAIIQSMLKNDQAFIRLKITADEEVYYSDDVCIKVIYQNKQTTKHITTNSTKKKSSNNKTKMYQASALAMTRSQMTTHTITINYIFENGTEVFAPYIATIASNTSFHPKPIKSPIRVGYKPFFEDGTPADEVQLNYDSVTSDDVINIIYKPQIVQYKIKRYGQNTYDDNYTLISNETREGLADSMISDANLEIPGFTQLYFEDSTIAADGSTELTIYYDRNYYLLYFDLIGGYGVEPVYARYGTAIMPNVPEKAGYVFESWQLKSCDPVLSDQELIDLKLRDEDVNNTNLFTIPYSNVTYRAVWKTVLSSYTIIYWKEDTDYSSRPTYSYWTSITIDELSNTEINPDDLNMVPMLNESMFSSNDSKQAYMKEKNYFTYVENDGGGKLVQGDGSTVVNVLYKRKEYTLRYYYARSYDENNTTVYQVVGGTTYPFGAYNSSTNANTPIETLLSNVDAWGKVKALPTVNESYRDRYHYDSVTYGDYTYYFLEFTEKYGADLSELWPIGIFDSVEIDEYHGQCSYDHAYFSAWNGEFKVKYTQDNKSSNYGNETIKGLYMKLDENIIFSQNFNDIPYQDVEGKQTNLVSYLGFWDNGANISWSVPKLFRYNLCLEALDGEGDYSYLGGYPIYDLYKTINTFDDSEVKNQTATSIDGFTYIGRSYHDLTTSVEGIEDDITKYDVFFFYDRNTYNLSFYNYNHTVSNHTVYFDESLKNYNFVPEYPDSLEADAYEFTGWYTTPDCIELLKVDFENDKMPASDLELYAGWEKVTHTINIYDDYQAMIDQNIKDVKYVKHGNMAFYNESTPTKDGYSFMGWFYIEDGEKKAFKFGSMPVNKDIELFAEWQSQNIVPYHIEYVTVDANGNEIKIAPDTNGLMNEGVTRTFKPKVGDQLEVAYRENYYPAVSSHSILMSPGENNYKFYYEYRASINYTIEYREAITNELISEDLFINPTINPITHSTTNSVVTHTFAPVREYIPDAYQKRLTLTLNESENKIVFYYHEDSKNGIFYISHYLQNDDGSYREVINETGTSPIGSLITRDPKTFEGYEFIASKSNVAGNIGNVGLHLEFYYDLKQYDYEIRWLVYGTDQEIVPSETGKKNYGQSFSGDAKLLEGYTLIGAPHQEKVIQDEASLNQNIITFYYNEEQVTILYEKVVDGYDDNTSYVSSSSEILGAASGNASGSKAVNGSNYRFDGWYYDEACLVKVDDALLNGNEIIPQKENGLYKVATYYAKFTLLAADLTIKKDGWNNKDVNQTFVFHIKGIEDQNAHIDLDFTIHEDGQIKICDLPIGRYEISENTDWSWRYDELDPIEVEVKYNNANEITVTNVRSESKWLDGDHYRINLFNN